MKNVQLSTEQKKSFVLTQIVSPVCQIQWYYGIGRQKISIYSKKKKHHLSHYGNNLNWIITWSLFLRPVWRYLTSLSMKQENWRCFSVPLVGSSCSACTVVHHSHFFLKLYTVACVSNNLLRLTFVCTFRIRYIYLHRIHTPPISPSRWWWVRTCTLLYYRYTVQIFICSSKVEIKERLGRFAFLLSIRMSCYF